MLILLIAGLMLSVFVDPIAQASSYHQFSDSRSVFSIPNFINVFSNLPFLLIGLFSIQQLLANRLVILNELRWVYLIFFAGVIFIAIGSSYYHLWPTNRTLVWDRLPMTIAFMSLFSIIIAEFISLRSARLIVWPLLILGVSSVIYWQLSENAGQGDLRPYILVQFLPLLMVPVIFGCFDSRFSHNNSYWWLLGFYLLAKLAEHFDAQLHSYLGLISGHSLKHIFAALGIGLVVLSYTLRIDKKTAN